ncbi:hypothetical protein FOL47_002859 [Perkinsus chesapeaki]|uniref:beta-N-acetylhexosaminidase n=1 Tax=Perkinsus chesapeaki TaxID=330153 RepID=A0A7J6MCS2_PERCH|nr:hypothetical protein FOL47_002859 [Perkinsus chesapeaki]
MSRSGDRALQYIAMVEASGLGVVFVIIQVFGFMQSCFTCASELAIPLSLPPQPQLNIWPVPKVVQFGKIALEDVAGFKKSTSCMKYENSYVEFLFETFYGNTTDLNITVHTHCEGKDKEPSGQYEIKCQDPECDITYFDKPGLVYAIGTLAQLLRNHDDTDKILKKGVRILDYPSFSHRGLLIDTGRRYLPISEIYDTLKLMASVKMNILHWHATDDISFSIDVKEYPRLQHGNPSRAKYTADDISLVQKMARSFAINVIPEIDIPGHTESWIRGYPSLKGNAKYYMDPISKKTEKFVSEVVERFVDMFNGSDPILHLGGNGIADAWDTNALKNWTRVHGRYHNKSDLFNYWLENSVKRIKNLTGKFGNAYRAR